MVERFVTKNRQQREKKTSSKKAATQRCPSLSLFLSHQRAGTRRHQRPRNRPLPHTKRLVTESPRVPGGKKGRRLSAWCRKKGARKGRKKKQRGLKQKGLSSVWFPFFFRFSFLPLSSKKKTTSNENENTSLHHTPKPTESSQ